MSVSLECSVENLDYQPSVAIPNRLRDWLLPPSQFSLVADTSERQQVESYIAERFNKEYKATVNEFMPQLVRMDCCGNTSAAVGIRCANSTSLFVEQYLDQAVEQVLAQYADSDFEGNVARSKIVELGNLVASHRGASRLLFLTVANCLHQAGIEWIVFAATRQVAKLVAKFPCETHDLGPAEPHRLGENAHKWGSYYDTNPHVIAMHLPKARAQIKSSTMATMVLHLYQGNCEQLAQQLSQAFQLAAYQC